MKTTFYRKIIPLGLMVAFSVFLGFGRATGNESVYARADKSAPVLNTPNFRSVFGGRDGVTLKRDASGLIREVEYIALPGTAFEIEASQMSGGVLVYRVKTAEYPSPQSGLFIDSRFVSVSSQPFSPRAKTMPAPNQILSRMANRQGVRYIWGGNTASGIPEILEYYPPSVRLRADLASEWSLAGLDCSGLLYEATGGSTPRNTSDLIRYGKSVAIAGLTAEQIAAKVAPLDLIVWRGHVVIVLDSTRTIESCQSCSPTGGVTVRNLKAVLKEVMRTRTPMNVYPAQAAHNVKPFVIRRWI